MSISHEIDTSSFFRGLCEMVLLWKIDQCSRFRKGRVHHIDVNETEGTEKSMENIAITPTTNGPKNKSCNLRPDG